ncbi:hypothetical protein PMAYCL1PPCAC_33151, partial [Pristionchus mayeri]
HIVLILVTSSLLQLTASSEFPVIKTSYGSLRGYTFTAEDGTEALIFKRIPFASAPIGRLRWRKPAPPQSWNGTIDSTFFGPACGQRTIQYDGPITGFSEDCLHLNVYTKHKSIESNARCPVLFVIHGGSGLYESTMKFPDETLTRNFVAEDIVVVTTAYRLGAFGALALGDENALPANLALHDIIAALKFTRAEIGHFGGDKERITILGHSAGGQYALMLAFSPGISKPGEKRLFDGVVCMSGDSRLKPQEESVMHSHKLTSKLGCEGTAQEIMDCLRLFDTEAILAASFEIRGYSLESTMSGESPSGVTMAGELFPISSQLEFHESTDPVRLMIGTTIYEMPGGAGVDRVNQVIGIKNDEECYEKYKKDVASGVFVTYYSQASQDCIMTTHMYAKHQAEIGGEAYLYEYGDPDRGIHTDDVYFVLGFHKYELNENQKWMSRVYPRYFSNFIRGERPAQDWSSVTPTLMNYYSINRSISEDVYPHTR